MEKILALLQLFFLMNTLSSSSAEARFSGAYSKHRSTKSQKAAECFSGYYSQKLNQIKSKLKCPVYVSRKGVKMKAHLQRLTNVM